MTDNLPNLGLPLLMPSQAQKHVTHNEALQILDSVTQLTIRDQGRTTPPAAPAEGDRHIVGAAATGDWAGQDQAIATWTGTHWRFDAPVRGWLGFDDDSGETLRFDGAVWTPLPVASELNNLSRVGVNTSADATNPLSVSGTATLLSHDGSDHFVKVNKAAQSDTASLLFQTNFSGRAEMGLAGQDNWSIKVSADGTSWTTALAFDAATGAASGAALQQSADDTTPGRLMRADYGYGPGNLLGAVSQSGGAPTGAVIESGSNANGSYTRFADGTQICRRVLAVDVTSTAQQDFTFAAPFQLAAEAETPGAALSNLTVTPNTALVPSNIAGLACTAATLQLRLSTAGSSTDPTDPAEKLVVTAIGRWV